MERIIVKIILSCIMVIITIIIARLSKTPTVLPPYVTSLVPDKGEILFVNTPHGGTLFTQKKIGSDRGIPYGFFYVKYIPEILTEQNYLFKETYYLNDENINDFRKPIKTEVNNTGVFMLFETNKPYNKQVYSHTAYYAVSSDAEQKVFMQCENIIKSLADMTEKFGNNEFVSIENRSYGDVVEKIYHAQFDIAFLINRMGRNYDYWEFVGYKHLESPVRFYSFYPTKTPLNEDNISHFIVYGDMLEFSISFFVSPEHGAYVVMGKNEIINIVSSIERYS